MPGKVELPNKVIVDAPVVVPKSRYEVMTRLRLAGALTKRRERAYHESLKLLAAEVKEAYEAPMEDPPSIRQLAAWTGMSRAWVHRATGGKR